MKIELRCSGCGKGYLVDESAIDAGLPCPGCSAPLGAAKPAATEPQAAKPRPVAPQPEATQPPAPLPRSHQRPGVTNRVASSAAPEIAIDRPAPPPAPAAAPAAVPAATVVATTAQPATPTPPAAAPKPASTPAVAAQPATEMVTEEVVCPRCELHFSPRTKASVAREASRKRQKVLVVEDMAYFREIAAEALADEYEVKGVATTDGALSVLGQGGVDLMVLDLTLDGGDGGLDLLRQLGTKPCPILIYTAQDESEMYGDSWEELKGYGADDIVIKGMNVGDQLVRKVGTLLGKNWESDD